MQGAGCPRRAFSFFFVFFLIFYTLCPMKETEDRLGVLALLLCARRRGRLGMVKRDYGTPAGLGSLSNWRPILVVSTNPFASGSRDPISSAGERNPKRFACYFGVISLCFFLFCWWGEGIGDISRCVQ